MPELVAMIQTTWSNIRVALYKRENGQFQFMEEGLDESSKEIQWQCAESYYFNDVEDAKRQCSITTAHSRKMNTGWTRKASRSWKLPISEARIIRC